MVKTQSTESVFEPVGPDYCLVHHGIREEDQDRCDFAADDEECDEDGEPRECDLRPLGYLRPHTTGVSR